MGRMSWRPVSIVPVWVVVAAAIAVVAGWAPRAHYGDALGVILGVSVVLTFAAQLALQQKEGFVRRIAIGVSGSVILLAAASAILLPLQLA